MRSVEGETHYNKGAAPPSLLAFLQRTAFRKLAEHWYAASGDERPRTPTDYVHNSTAMARQLGYICVWPERRAIGAFS